MANELSVPLPRGKTLFFKKKEIFPRSSARGLAVAPELPLLGAQAAGEGSPLSDPSVGLGVSLPLGRTLPRG